MFTFINLHKVRDSQPQKSWYLELNDFMISITYFFFFLNMKEDLDNIYWEKLETNFPHHDSAMIFITDL